MAASLSVEEGAKIMSLLEKNHSISIRKNAGKNLGGKEGLWEELGHHLRKRRAWFRAEHQERE